MTTSSTSSTTIGTMMETLDDESLVLAAGVVLWLVVVGGAVVVVVVVVGVRSSLAEYTTPRNRKVTNPCEIRVCNTAMSAADRAVSTATMLPGDKSTDTTEAASMPDTTTKACLNSAIRAPSTGDRNATEKSLAKKNSRGTNQEQWQCPSRGIRNDYNQ